MEWKSEKSGNTAFLGCFFENDDALSTSRLLKTSSPLTCVVCGPAVVCRREQSDEVSLRESLEAVHDALVRADNHLELVLLAKLDDPVGPKGDEPGASRRGLHSLDSVVGRRIGPEQVHQHEPSVLHLQWALELGDLLDPVDRPADTSVHAEDAVLNERGQG